MSEKRQNRILYLDLLRIISAMGVMSIHFSNRVLGDSFGDFRWTAFVAYNSLGRFAVPVFIMISGGIFLDLRRPCEIKRLYCHNILHLATAFAFWSVLNAMWRILTEWNFEIAITGQMLKDLIKSVILGPTQLWYLFVMAALYMITPLLRKIAEDRKLTEYFLLLWVVFTMFASFTTPISYLQVFRDFLRKFELRMAVGYSGYYLLGFYLINYWKDISKRKRTIYLGGLGAYLFTVAVTVLLSLRKGEYVQTYLGGEMLNCLAMALAVFVGVKSFCEKHRISVRISDCIHKIAECSFGIYLTHMMALYLLNQCGIVALLSDCTLIGLPCIIVLSIMICIGIVMGLKKIPILGKWIV